MLAKGFIVAAVATAAFAQSSTSSASSSGSTACAGQNILDACKATIQAQINTCATNDYSCLCTAYTNYVGCYGSSGCSSDPTIGTAQQEKELNCNNASVYGSTTILGTASATSAATATTTNSSATSAVSGFGSGTSTGSSSGASSTSSSSSNAADSIKTTGGVFAIVAAGIAALL